MNRKIRWFTCTPVRFKGDHTFFARDSGLLCKGFQEIGVECEAIMPGPPMDGDQEDDLIRTDYQNLEDPDWWRSLGCEGVVFYGWGSGKYLGIVQAIKEAGCVLVTHIDAAGMLGVLNGPFEFASTLYRVSLGESPNIWYGMARFILRLGYASSISLIKNDIGRARHLRAADWIGAISPIAKSRIQRVCKWYGGNEMVSKVRLISHPIAPYMVPEEVGVKERLVVAAGRWDDERVKGTTLLKEVVEHLLQDDPDVRVEIYGRFPAWLGEWHGSLGAHDQLRVAMPGVVRNEDLRAAYSRAKVSVCTSLRESFHISSAEALCCGCSVVGPDVPEIPSLKWFTGEGYGSLAKRVPRALADAVLGELKAWDGGGRCADRIAALWQARLHAPQVARRILELKEETPHSDRGGVR